MYYKNDKFWVLVSITIMKLVFEIYQPYGCHFLYLRYQLQQKSFTTLDQGPNLNKLIMASEFYRIMCQAYATKPFMDVIYFIP